MPHHALIQSHLQALDDCAKRLQLSPEETLRRAIARLHCFLFQSEADLEDVDYSQSVGILEGAGVTTACIFEKARSGTSGGGHDESVG